MTPHHRPTACTLAALAALTGALLSPSVQAQSNDETLKELKALRERVEKLEAQLKANQGAAKPAEPQWGMTPQQVQDFNRIAVKTEALEDAVEAQGLKQLKIAGYIDPTYIYNQRQRRSGFQLLNRVSDDGYNYDNSYFGVLSLDFQKEMEGGTKWRLTLMPNRGAGSIADSSGNSVVHEASVMIPLGDLQTRFIAGQIPDWSGYEYVQPIATKLVTRGLLLDFTEPTAYTGAGMEYIRGKWDTKWLLANYNTTKNAQGQRSPVLAYRVDYSKGEFNGFGFAGVHGKVANFRDTSDNPKATRLDLFEADAYFIRGDFTWQGQIGIGGQKKAAIAADADGNLQDSRWLGVSTLLAYKFIPRWEAVARLDYIKNTKNGGGLLGYTSNDGRNGIGQGVIGTTTPDAESSAAPEPILSAKGANRTALAVGFNFLYNLNTTFKAEYRLDQASQPVFFDVASGGYRKSNQLFGTSVVVSF
ncbi:MAG: hypothetical protein CFE45_18450 [Burkholderiales bacterium PBB5]|nr:MAG: hypothetical protein CFE45_18450 [Burkholderiales bacterium PBB5]